MTMQLEKLKALAQEATPGPWHWTWDGAGQPGRVGKTLPCEPVEDCGYNSHCIALTQEAGRFDQQANAAFIAAADPATVLRLLAVVEAAKVAAHPVTYLDVRDGLDALRAALDALLKDGP